MCKLLTLKTTVTDLNGFRFPSKIKEDIAVFINNMKSKSWISFQWSPCWKFPHGLLRFEKKLKLLQLELELKYVMMKAQRHWFRFSNGLVNNSLPFGKANEMVIRDKRTINDNNILYFITFFFLGEKERGKVCYITIIIIIKFVRNGKSGKKSPFLYSSQEGEFWFDSLLIKISKYTCI